jgi:hypothetical protein
MGGYAFSSTKGSRKVAKILEEMKFALNRPWRYNLHFVIVEIKGNKGGGTK